MARTRADLKPVVHHNVRMLFVKMDKEAEGDIRLLPIELEPNERIVGVRWEAGGAEVTIVEEVRAPSRKGQPLRSAWVFDDLTVHERCAGDTLIDPNKKYRFEVDEEGVFQLYEDIK